METGVTVRMTPATHNAQWEGFRGRHLQKEFPLGRDLQMDIWGVGGCVGRAGEGKRQSGILVHFGFEATNVYQVVLKPG